MNKAYWVTTKDDVNTALDEFMDLIQRINGPKPLESALAQQIGKVRAIVDHLPLKEKDET